MTFGSPLIRVRSLAQVAIYNFRVTAAFASRSNPLRPQFSTQTTCHTGACLKSSSKTFVSSAGDGWFAGGTGLCGLPAALYYLGLGLRLNCFLRLFPLKFHICFLSTAVPRRILFKTLVRSRAGGAVSS